MHDRRRAVFGTWRWRGWVCFGLVLRARLRLVGVVALVFAGGVVPRSRRAQAHAPGTAGRGPSDALLRRIEMAPGHVETGGSPEGPRRPLQGDCFLARHGRSFCRKHRRMWVRRQGPDSARVVLQRRLHHPPRLRHVPVLLCAQVRARHRAVFRNRAVDGVRDGDATEGVPRSTGPVGHPRSCGVHWPGGPPAAGNLP